MQFETIQDRDLAESLDNLLVLWQVVEEKGLCEKDIKSIDKHEKLHLLYIETQNKRLTSIIWRPDAKINKHERDKVYKTLKEAGINVSLIRQNVFESMFNINQSTVSTDVKEWGFGA